jgi:hypothetical protein
VGHCQTYLRRQPAAAAAAGFGGWAPAAAFDRDPFAGTPWHKRVPARIERVAAPA